MVADVKTVLSSVFTVKIKLMNSHVSRYIYDISAVGESLVFH